MNARGLSSIAARPAESPAPARRGILQRKCACGGNAAAGGECEECRKKKLQRRATGPEPAEVPPIVHRVLQSSGASLDADARSFMEAHFGRDLGDVRVHTGGEAAQSATAVRAEAYTVGNQIVFGSGRYTPHSQAGNELLAHELAHVVQQSGSAPAGSSIELGEEGSAQEAQAERSAESIARPDQTNPVVQPESRRMLARQAAPQLKPTIPPAPPTPAGPQLRVIQGGQAAAERELARRGAQRVATQTVRRAGWRHFWRLVIRRLALRGATAAALAVIDGPLPIGDLIALGLTLWMIWDIIEAWDTIWQEAEQEARTDPAPEPAPLPTPQPAPQPAPEEDRRQRQRCMEQHPGAQICDEPLNDGDDARDEILVEFLMTQGLPFDALGDCYRFGESIQAGVIDDCGGAPAIRYHCRINGETRELSIFGCLCCDRNGVTRFQWSRPHWSTNLSRRGGR